MVGAARLLADSRPPTRTDRALADQRPVGDLIRGTRSARQTLRGQLVARPRSPDHCENAAESSHQFRCLLSAVHETRDDRPALGVPANGSMNRLQARGGTLRRRRVLAPARGGFVIHTTAQASVVALTALTGAMVASGMSGDVLAAVVGVVILVAVAYR